MNRPATRRPLRAYTKYYESSRYTRFTLVGVRATTNSGRRPTQARRGISHGHTRLSMSPPTTPPSWGTVALRASCHVLVARTCWPSTQFTHMYPAAVVDTTGRPYGVERACAHKHTCIPCHNVLIYTQWTTQRPYTTLLAHQPAAQPPHCCIVNSHTN